MSRWADWFAITPAEAKQFQEAANAADFPDDEVNELLEPWLERLEQLPLHVDMDKMWEPIHRCLTGDHSAVHKFDIDAGEHPLNLCVMGGEQLLEEGHRTAALISADEVPAVATALTGIPREWFRERFFALPKNQFHEINEEIFEWVWAEFEKLPPFFVKVAAMGNAVICTISY